MRYFFSYLMQNPLIRLTTFWLVMGCLGISVFSWKMMGMRVELLELNQDIQSSVMALQQIDRNREVRNQEELEKIIQEIEKYRPAVPELLGFVENVEDLIRQLTLDFELNSLKTQEQMVGDQREFVTYRIEARADLDALRKLLHDFESSPYATEIRSLQVKENLEGSFDLDLTFILYTRL